MPRSFRELRSELQEFSRRFLPVARQVIRYMIAPAAVMGGIAVLYACGMVVESASQGIDNVIAAIGRIVESSFPLVASQLHLTEWQLGVTTVVVVVALYLLWAVPKGEVERVQKTDIPAGERLQLELEARKLEDEKRRTLAQVFGGTFLILTIYLTYRTFQLSQSQQMATQEVQTAELIAKGIDQLSDDRMAIRVGGILRLERMARASGEDHDHIMPVLLAYLRERQDLSIKPLADGQLTNRPPTDVQSIIDVLGRRNFQRELTAPDTSSQFDRFDLDLSGMFLMATVFEEANFSGADFRGSILKRIQVTGDSDFSGAVFTAADLEDAWLGKSTFVETTFREAHLENAKFYDCNLTGASFQDAYLQNASFSLSDMNGVSFEGAHLEGADFRSTLNLIDKSVVQRFAFTDENTKWPN